jgi:hypothetical protein
MTGRDALPPAHSIEAEQALIGGLLLDNLAWGRIAGTVAEADFYRDDHRRIFAHIRKLIEGGEHADVLAVADALQEANLAEQTGGLAYLGELANAATVAGIAGAARIVRRDSDRRRLIAAAREIEQAAASADPAAALGSAEARITELRAQMKPREARYRLRSASELADLPPLRWLVRGILPAEGLGAIFGASGSGKSFLALDLAAAVADGLDWFGCATQAAHVTYAALEGEAGFSQRTQAWREHHGRNLPAGLHFVMPATFDLRDAGDVRELAEAVTAAGAAGGLLILDTLNRAAAGADENDSAGMGEIIAGLKALQRTVGGLVLAVHHSGKDQARGMRGHSSLHAALDAAVEVARTDDRREWIVRKNKDGEDGKTHPFRLRGVEIGTDADGEPITSCVVEAAEDAGEAVRRVRVPQGGNQRIVWDALGELLRASHAFGKAGAPPTRPCVELEAAIASVRDKLATDPKRRTERTRQAITGLVASGLLKLNEGWLWAA